jgi:tetratricopeptide (TPR) repeat protein
MEHIDKGNKQLEEESYRAALKSFNLHLKEEGDHYQAFLGKAISYRKMGEYTRSHAEFVRALELSPDNPELLSEKAVTFFQEKKIEEAIALFDRARKLDPENPYRHSSLAFAQAKAGFMFEAIEHYEKAVQLDPDDAIAHNNLGLLKENIGYAQNAQVHFKKSDNLIGRNPRKMPVEKAGKRKDTISSNQQNINSTKPSSLSQKSGLNFLWVLKSLFKSSDERKGFLVFLKGLFTPSREK